MIPGDRESLRRAVARLRRRPELQALSRLARRRGIGVWIVGGALRDRCLGLAVPELDLAVTRDAEGLADELEREGFGRAVFLSRDRPGPRVFRIAAALPLDIAEIEGGSIEADLSRRDFTVNAVAVALDGGEIVDPYGGLADLAARRLRCVREENLLEDPLRALRAARLLATRGLTPDRATLAASRRAAPGLSAVAAERIAAELAKLLASPVAAPALGWAARAGVLSAALGRDATDARIAAAVRGLRRLDDGATRRLPPQRRRRLRLALLADRLGLSAAQIRRWLGERRWARPEREEVAGLVELVSSASRVSSRRDAWSWVLEAGPLAEDALFLVARSHPSDRRRLLRLRRFARSRLRTVAVTGEDVIRWLAIPPGPQVGYLLSALRLAAATGEVKNRREARSWLSVQVRNSRPRAIISEH